MKFKILNNVPLEIIQTAINSWDNFIPIENKNYFKIDEHMEVGVLSSDDPMHLLLKKYINDFKCKFLVNPANCGLGPVHTDNSLNCCINVPIKVNLEKSCFFAIKSGENVTTRKAKEDEVIHGQEALRFLYEPEKYDYYNLRTPVALNNKLPHGYYNFDNEDRVLLNISFSCSYDEMIELIPKEWF